jgi:hypothetical protein
MCAGGVLGVAAGAGLHVRAHAAEGRMSELWPWHALGDAALAASIVGVIMALVVLVERQFD